MSTPVSNNGSDSDGSATRKRVFSIPLEEEIEPYVRRRRISSERNRKRLEKLSEEEQNLLRTSINSRERRRMHDLNDALDELRTVLPYSHGASARRLSKINTIILASNCIRNLNKRFTDISAENQQLRAMIPEDKLSTIKSIELPPIQLATTIDTDFSPTLMPPAKSRRLSSSPVDHQKIDLPANVNSKKGE
ncbi:Helix-loop-helix DNA-binding domain protein [Aphelenchoides bicaudatus]|nr:Helix-loop-helix DNA-binding domain protein [Aphelenchoides bicaudatus]